VPALGETTAEEKGKKFFKRKATAHAKKEEKTFSIPVRIEKSNHHV